MINYKEIEALIKQREGAQLEFKAVLPPSRNIAQIVSSFANTDGGYLILGVSEAGAKIEVHGLSRDFRANSITHKAIDLLNPQPNVKYEYVNYDDKDLFVIKVEKATNGPIEVEGKIYIRSGAITKLATEEKLKFKTKGYDQIELINQRLQGYKSSSTNSKARLIEHYQSILKLIDDLDAILYPSNPLTPTTNSEGKVLTRILFSSFVDNFETYLSDLLYEIFLARPETLKSKQQVSVEEVLNCADLHEFVKYHAKQKLYKLQRGSVKGFIKDNKQISQLNVLDEVKQQEIEKILQIRHLYSHRNGIIDEKFKQYFRGNFPLNTEHQLSIQEVCSVLDYMIKVADDLDKAAIGKYNLDTV